MIGDFTIKGQCIIDDAENLLILHPDQLISSTVVADSFGCMRRAVLQDRVKATSEASAPLVYGTILHEIFQEALLANKWDRPFLTKVIERTTDKHVEDLYAIKVSMALAREHLESKMAELTHWASAFVSSEPKVCLCLISMRWAPISDHFCSRMVLWRVVEARKPTWQSPSY